jgi:hypothetical protein
MASGRPAEVRILASGKAKEIGQKIGQILWQIKNICL